MAKRLKLNLEALEKYQKERDWNDTQLAENMEMSPSQVSRVKDGINDPGEDFVAGALKAFPELSFDDLFIIPGVVRARNISRQSKDCAGS